MKYMIMTFGDESAWDTLGLGATEATWTQEKIAEHFQSTNAFYADLAASGEMVTGFGLANPSHTVTVEVRDGRPLASDGPYTETKEVLAGFGIIDVASHDRAVELAARFAGIVQTRVELRPVMNGSDEDAVQEALLAAATTWQGAMPHNPAGWLTTTATRRLTDLLRSEQSRHRREQTEARRSLPPAHRAPDAVPLSEQDDSLVLLFLCCHPALTPPAQVALTLRAVGSLSTAEIAQSLLLPEATITRRITRAKQSILDAGGSFALPAPADRAARLDVVLHVIYLIFTEGHTATAGDALVRSDLCAEAIRLGRLLRRLAPSEPEVGGLLAQMLLVDARRVARTDSGGQLVPLAEQERSRWDHAAIAEGIDLVTESLGRRRPGPYQLQAAINALHAEATSFAETDWPQILALYGVLDRMADDPMVTLNRTVALAHVEGPAAALRLLSEVAAHPRLAGHHRVHAVRAHLLQAAGRRAEASEQYRTAARLTLSTAERRYLLRQAASADRPAAD